MDTDNNPRGPGKLIKLVKRVLGTSTPEIDEVHEFHNKLSMLVRERQQVSESLRIISNWERVLSNQETGENAPSLITNGKRAGVFEAYNKKWIALRLAFNLYRALLQSRQKFEGMRKQSITQIFALDPELAKKIVSLKMPQGRYLENLHQLREVMERNPDIAANYIKTHYDEIMKQLDSIQDPSKREELRKLIIAASNEELKALEKCVADIRSWPYRVSYGIDLFIERPKLFLIGGKSKFDNEAFLGLRVYFRDLDLERQVYGNAENKRLITYKEELRFFSEARYAIKKSDETQGRWEGFYDFYNNLDKRKNYIGTVRDRFGNEEFARLLEIFKEKKHEAPVDWEHELGELTERLIKRAYPLVVEPAGQALMRIFNARIASLSGKRETAIEELKAKLAEGDSDSKFKKQFLGIVETRRGQLKKELENERREFESMNVNLALAANEFSIRFEKLIAQVDSRREIGAEKQIIESSLGWRRFIIGHIRQLDSNPEAISTQYLERSTYGMINTLRAAISELKYTRILRKRYIGGLRELD